MGGAWLSEDETRCLDGCAGGHPQGKGGQRMLVGVRTFDCLRDVSEGCLDSTVVLAPQLTMLRVKQVLPLYGALPSREQKKVGAMFLW